MNLLFWKHKTEKHVIKQNCLNKLPIATHSYYEQTEDEPTHHYDDGSGLITGILIGEALSSDNIPSGEFVGTDTPDKFDGFGGGDFGGGGSGGSYDTPSTDNSSSYDSGTSYDSGSNYDSSSSDSSSSFDSSSY